MELISEGLLRRQQKYLRDLHHIPDEDLDLAPSFPRLRIACFHRDPTPIRAWSTRNRITLADINVEIFKPIRFEELQSRCRPLRAVGSFDMLCIFSVDPRFSTSPSRHPDSRSGGNIRNLVVAEGAGIIAPPNCRTEGRLWDVASRGIVEDPTTDFWLVLKDPMPTPLTASTIDFILAFMDFGRATTIATWNHEPHMELKCYPSVFASFVSLVSIIRPLSDGAHEIRSLAAQSGKDVAKSHRHIIGSHGFRKRHGPTPDTFGRVCVAPLAASSVAL